MSRTISLSVEYPQSPAAVWRALTDSALLARWLMPNDFEPRVGHRFQFRTRPAPGFDGVVSCEVLEIAPERRLAFTWVGGGVDTIVTFAIEPHRGGTRLQFTQTGFTGARGTVLSFLLANGWGGMLRKRLPALLPAPHPAAGTVGCEQESTRLWRVLDKLWGRGGS